MAEKLDKEGYPVSTQKVSPEALQAFYRQRSESLHRNTTKTQTAEMQTTQKQNDAPAQQAQLSWYQRIIEALSLGQ